MLITDRMESTIRVSREMCQCGCVVCLAWLNDPARVKPFDRYGHGAEPPQRLGESLQYYEMTETTDSLLAELVELQRRQLANQERHIATQEEAVARMRKSIEANRKTQKWIWGFVIVIFLTAYLVPLLNWLVRRGN
jgi:hypothetical protein